MIVSLQRFVSELSGEALSGCKLIRQAWDFLVPF